MARFETDRLALFGGTPMFDRPRPTGQIYTPDRAALLGRVDAILKGRRYSNGGPFQCELEERLAEWHGVPHVIAFANACLALIVLMRALSVPGRDIVALPSFSYRGLPHFIQWAGHMPRFADVDETTHALHRRTVEPTLTDGRVGAILAVNNVTAPADLDGLEALSAETGIPVIYDSVYAIAATWQGRPFGGAGRAEVFSLHATKLVNGFEGGYVTTDDPDLALQLRHIRNFGYDSRSPEIVELGLNGKLNELHAAMALASLDGIDAALAHNRAVIAAYRDGLRGVPGVRILDPVPGMVPNDEMVLLEIDPEHPIRRDDWLRLLQAEGALARPYFSPPLHRSKNCPPAALGADLPVTDTLAGRFVQLPTGALVSEADARRIAQCIADVTAAGRHVAQRLMAAAVPAEAAP